MNDLRKAAEQVVAKVLDTRSVKEIIEEKVKQGCSARSKRMAVMAIEFFDDRPAAKNQDLDLMMFKLAAHLERHPEFAEEDLVAGLMALDVKVEWRPTPPQILNAVRRAYSIRLIEERENVIQMHPDFGREPEPTSEEMDTIKERMNDIRAKLAIVPEKENL